MADDPDIIRRVLEGEEALFRVLVDRHAGTLVAWLRWFVPDVHEREDVAQDAFLAAWRRLGRFDPTRGSFRGWLLTIGRNLALNGRRRAN